jgi:hypothetical protein
MEAHIPFVFPGHVRMKAIPFDPSGKILDGMEKQVYTHLL